LEANSKVRNTTPIKLIKKAIRHYLTLQPDDPIPDYSTPNQLDLFEEALAEYGDKESKK
jgi:hypothetical protein